MTVGASGREVSKREGLGEPGPLPGNVDGSRSGGKVRQWHLLHSSSP